MNDNDNDNRPEVTDALLGQLCDSHHLLMQQRDTYERAVQRAMQAVRRIDFESGPRVCLPLKVEDALRPVVDAVVQATLDDLERRRRFSSEAADILRYF